MCVCGRGGDSGKNKHKWPGNHKENSLSEEHPKKKKNNHHHTESLLGVFMHAEDLYALCFIPMHHFSCSTVVAFFKRGRQRHQFAKVKDFYE